jgi:hypothetical protein
MQKLLNESSLLVSAIAKGAIRQQEQLVQEKAEKVATEVALREAEARGRELGERLYQALERINAREKEWELRVEKAPDGVHESQAEREREGERGREKEWGGEQQAAQENEETSDSHHQKLSERTRQLESTTTADEALEKMRADLVAMKTAKDKEVKDTVERVIQKMEEVQEIESAALRDECSQLTAENSELKAKIDELSREYALRECEIMTAQAVRKNICDHHLFAHLEFCL